MRGHISSFDVSRSRGFIKPDEPGPDIFAHRSSFIDRHYIPLPGDEVEFEIEQADKGPQARSVRRTAPDTTEPEVSPPAAAQRPQRPHDDHCFVVMPFGANPGEVRWYRGWYETVIRPTIVEAGYKPILAASEERPNAINDEIRTHLAFDPMVVVDLGGPSPDLAPNPNVMYELGIRHALDQPLVMMAWSTQELPFDIANQRVVMEDRELLDLDVNRRKLANFIAAARAGDYYRPMEAVGRVASIEIAVANLGRSSLLGSLAREIRELRARLEPRTPWPAASREKKKGLKGQWGNNLRQTLYDVYRTSGGDIQRWPKVLFASPPEGSQDWTVDEWSAWITTKADEYRLPPPLWQPQKPGAASSQAPSTESETLPDSGHGQPPAG